MRDIVDVESWAGRDDDFSRSLAFTPAAFTWVRDRAHLVELPALWCRVPVLDRDPEELAEAIASTLAEEGCPEPHVTLQGGAHLVVLWAIQPLRRPKKTAPEPHHFAWRRCLEDWRKAAVKLSFALQPLGALPLDPATVDDLMLDFVPLPLPAGSLMVQALALHQEAPRLVAGAEHFNSIVIADVSKPLGRHDTRMFATFGIDRARSKKEWLRSARSLAALEPQKSGERHLAALDIVCACVWDGLDYEASLAKLRVWAQTCVNDGTFPFRTGQGDELELLAKWALERLKPGGPTNPQDKPRNRRSTRDDVAAAVVGFLRSEGGSWTGSKVELSKQAALWSLGAGKGAACPLTTLKRALGELLRAASLAHTVARRAATWASTWTVSPEVSAEVAVAAGAEAPPDLPAPLTTILVPAEERIPRVQKGESMWAPGFGSAGFPSREGAAGEILLPAGGGPGGAWDPERPASIDEAGIVLTEHPPAPSGSPETTRTRRQRRESPRQRRLNLSREQAEGAPRRRRRGSEGKGLPPITDELLRELADVAPSLDEQGRRALLEAARAGLRPRKSVLANFAAALRKRALRLRRREVAASKQPEPVHEERRRVAQELAAEAQRPPIDSRTVADFRQLLSLAGTPLHDRSMADIARRLHDEGLSLLPLKPETKEPAATKWRERQREPMPLSSLRRQLAELGNNAGLAIICGPVSGLLVADLDDDSAVLWAERYLPPTPWRTKTSRGQHWFYRHPTGDIDTKNPPWKGQLQGEGRYVVAPGSLHPDGGRYEALGDWGQPKEALPIFEARWLVDVEALRAARQKILKGEP
ncbi:MAG: bifunctional DNA primase/polymerase [Deltaproteobacteria bacterium]|nr:bifunctional DNA primase/polymerase [Deltaproteobacteria bacterium]